jgi:hypothetical protein
MSIVVYLRTDPYHVVVSQGNKVTPGTFVPVGQADDDAQRSIDVVDGQGETVASFARDEVVGYYVQPGRHG